MNYRERLNRTCRGLGPDILPLIYYFCHSCPEDLINFWEVELALDGLPIDEYEMLRKAQEYLRPQL